MARNLSVMHVRVIGVLVVILSGIGTGTAYEYRTHHGITTAARSYLCHHPELFQNDEDFRRFIEDPGSDYHGYGYLIDMGAGDTSWHLVNGSIEFCEDPDASNNCQQVHTDEDHHEGSLKERWLRGCGYSEVNCGLRCTLDHFEPQLRLPLGLETRDKTAIRRVGRWGGER